MRRITIPLLAILALLLAMQCQSERTKTMMTAVVATDADSSRVRFHIYTHPDELRKVANALSIQFEDDSTIYVVSRTDFDTAESYGYFTPYYATSSDDTITVRLAVVPDQDTVLYDSMMIVPRKDWHWTIALMVGQSDFCSGCWGCYQCKELKIPPYLTVNGEFNRVFLVCGGNTLNNDLIY